MNCWSVLGLRRRDLSIIVLCQDIAAIDSSDTNLSPGITSIATLQGLRDTQLDNVTFTHELGRLRQPQLLTEIAEHIKSSFQQLNKKHY